MTRKTQLTDWQIEMVRAAYAESGNVAYAAKQAGIAYSPAYVYCKENWSDLQELRAKTKEDIIRDLSLLRRLAIEELMTPKRIKEATTQELMVMTGIITDKITNLQGLPTARVEFTHGQRQADFDAHALTPEDRERAREVQRKLSAGRRIVPLDERSIIDVASSTS